MTSTVAAIFPDILTVGPISVEIVPQEVLVDFPPRFEVTVAAQTIEVTMEGQS